MVGFSYIEVDLTGLLRPTWANDICFLAGKLAVRRMLTPTSVTSREASNVRVRPILLVDGLVLRQEVPWLFDLYNTLFLTHAKAYAKRPTYVAQNDLYALNLNIQWGGDMIYECHVDSNPVQGMLYTATLSPDEGGALVVGRDPRAASVEAVDRDCTEIYPKANHLVVFDARDAPHYVRAVKPGHARVAVAMNFYTDDCPETSRPPDLSQHLYGIRTN